MRYVIEFGMLAVGLALVVAGVAAAGWQGAGNAALVVGLVIALGLNWR